jgi:hypothetical protein
LRFGLLGEVGGEKLLPEAAEEAKKKWPFATTNKPKHVLPPVQTN